MMNNMIVILVFIIKLVPDEELSLEVPIIAIYKRKYIPKRRPSNVI